MNKLKSKILRYILGALIIFSWIIFLFLDTKGYNLSWNTIKTYFHISSQQKLNIDEDVGEDSPLREDDLEFLSGFLQENENLTTKDAEKLGNLKEKIAILEQIYTQQKTLEVVQLLMDAYMLDNQYEKAKKFYNSLPDSIKGYLEPSLPFKIGINSFSQTVDTEYLSLKKLLKEYRQQGIFSETESLYYEVAFDLIDGKYEEAQKTMQGLSGTRYEDFLIAIQSAFDQYNAIEEVPEYYQDGLIAYQLMKQGFLAGAKKIAIRLVNNYSTYILPYQVLANVDFLMGKRDSSLRYFHKLLELDPQEKSSYLYYLGICYYHLEDYSNAVLYLSQISDYDIMLDSDRYLILSYVQLGEHNRVFGGRKRLLGYPNIKAADFYSFFEEAFRKPYRKGEKSYYLQQDQKLVQDYLTACSLNLTGDDAQVCTYGQLGLLASQNSKIDAEQQLQLSRFARKYAKPEFFQYLGEIQLMQGNTEEASMSFMRALGLTKDSEEKNYLKQRILEANKI